MRGHRLGQAQRPGQVDGHDLVPDLHRQAVEVAERDRVVVGGVIDQDIEAAEGLGDLADQPIHRGIVGDVASEGVSVDLVMRGQFAGEAFRLRAALRVHNGDLDALPRERMADTLPQSAIAARHQCHRALQVHRCSPNLRMSGLAAATHPCGTLPRHWE